MYKEKTMVITGVFFVCCWFPYSFLVKRHCFIVSFLLIYYHKTLSASCLCTVIKYGRFFFFLILLSGKGIVQFRLIPVMSFSDWVWVYPISNSGIYTSSLLPCQVSGACSAERSPSVLCHHTQGTTFRGRFSIVSMKRFVATSFE